MAAGEVILGLLIEQPDNSYQLDQRLQVRCRSAQYSRGTARQALRRLEANRPVRKASGSQLPATAGEASEVTIYEATDAGVRHFRAWLHGAITLPWVREDLHARIALCGPDDIPQMIATIRDAELVCTSKLKGLNWRIRGERERNVGERWFQRMETVVDSGEVAWWDGRIKWLQALRLDLERERGDSPGAF
jgi:DNA-binding PadR family transcriptional regulator